MSVFPHATSCGENVGPATASGDDRSFETTGHIDSGDPAEVNTLFVSSDTP